jgi:vitamin B12 transporter
LYSEYGNKDLKPETTTSYELGAQYFSDKMNARITGFIRDGKDVFLWSGKYINGDQQHDYGIETEATVHFTDDLIASANYTFVNGAITTNSSGKDTSFFNLYKRPKNILNISLNYQITKKLFVSSNLKTVSKAFEPQSSATPYELKGYYTLGFYGQYQFNKKFTIFADLQNITCQTYFVTRGFTTKGFNINGGVRVKL